MAKERMQFEAGEGRHFQGGVNFIQGNGIYAEIEVPEGASEDYGYISMKQAIISQYPEAAGFDWWYDGQEDKLAADASADVEVYTEKEED